MSASALQRIPKHNTLALAVSSPTHMLSEFRNSDIDWVAQMAAIMHRKQMGAVLVRLARTIACRARLRILIHLSQAGELAPSELAARLTMGPTMVSDHLRELMAVGLITRRPQGAWLFARATPAYSLKTPSGRASQSIRTTVSSLDLDNADEVESECDRIFKTVTAFTNLRRLRILSLLAESGPLDSPTIRSKLKIPLPSYQRHIRKLRSRGFIITTQAGNRTLCAVPAAFATPLHKELWETFIQPSDRKAVN